ncbi:glycerol-3-phosphate dehydrogenase/oxidase [Actinopolymorpha alba]|uniref:glycerol-3-phosphate dehydrogenase/oxidase n=1 Tax=Actinopolymorpha alba TaxID=533267 RepID=UPI00035D0757|nr:glycerol-3-phosphate dehydrogenase/oxidase [Actinopolymorpha alba]
MRGSAKLGPQERAQAWDRFGEQAFDVLVVGGGITGAGVALDAVTRGLDTALVEARDFASGTSSRSSKLFHGGLRYLEQMNFGLVAEALKERELMLTRLAPHLVKPVPFLYPLKHRMWERPYVGAGLTLYDTMARGRSVPAHRHLTRTGALRLSPALRQDALIGAVRYYDGQADDARHTLTVIRTAARYGAVVRNSSEVTGFLHEGGRIVGAHIRDVDSGATTTIRAKVVINCTGVWTDEIQRLTGGRGRFRVRASKGVHVLVPRDRIASEVGLILRTEKSVLFVIPWGNHWIIGTTDTDWNLDLSHPAASRADIDYLLANLNEVLAVPLSHDDIEGVYAGLRPLLAGESEETSQLSREHAVARPLPGLVSIAGGKFTTYRVMAKDAVDAARPDLGHRLPPSVTEHVPLMGAEGYHALINQVDTLAEENGVPVWRMQRLLDRYGSMVDEVFELAEKDHSLLEPLPGAGEYLRVEAMYAATHEAAVHLDDVLARRTRISIEVPHRGTETAEPAAELMAGVLGWDNARTSNEVEVYKARVAAERESQTKPDDLTADAQRLLAPDTRKLAVGRALR